MSHSIIERNGIKVLVFGRSHEERDRLSKAVMELLRSTDATPPGASWLRHGGSL